MPHNFRALDERFQDARFILNVRDLGGWIYSRLAHLDRHGGRPGTNWTLSVDSICAWIVNRNHYHLDVMQHFSERPDNLLIVNFVRDADAAAKIVQFLGYDRDLPKPKANVNPLKQAPEKHQEMLRQAMQRLQLCEEDLQSDLLCASASVNPSNARPLDSAVWSGALVSS